MLIIRVQWTKVIRHPTFITLYLTFWWWSNRGFTGNYNCQERMSFYLHACIGGTSFRIFPSSHVFSIKKISESRGYVCVKLKGRLEIEWKFWYPYSPRPSTSAQEKKPESQQWGLVEKTERSTLVEDNEQYSWRAVERRNGLDRNRW
jgi:hypothetical protein